VPSDAPEPETQPRIHGIKFADRFVDPILRGQKTATIRVGDEWREVRVGDRLRLRDQDGEQFASAFVSERGWTSINMAARMNIDGHRDYLSADVLLAELRRHYPDHDLTGTSAVELIHWEDLQE
jgi:hypothetical protein